MSKTIVTHISPDFDGIPAIWLLKKFHPKFADAKIAYVPAGSTLNNEPVDSNPDIVHVDTGMGRFDHHQSDDFTCGAKLVYEWLIEEGYIRRDDEAMARLIEVVTELDHGWDNWKWSEAASDRWEFCLPNILVGWKILYSRQDEDYIAWTMRALEAVYKILQQKAAAEKELERATKFATRWGEGLALESDNGMMLDLGIKRGLALIVTRDPKKGFVRITGSNKYNVDLTQAYEEFRKLDPAATWFLHASKVLLRNGSTRNPTMVPTKLKLEEVVKVLEKA